MFNPMDYPRLVLVVSLPTFWISERIGRSLRENWLKPVDEGDNDFEFVLGTALTLLSLFVAFSFSMAVSRYDQRKNLEEQEANAIGTEYSRADLLPPAVREKVHVLLKSYLDQRILYYEVHNEQQLRQIDSQTARLQTELWSAVATSVGDMPGPVAALVLSGMNEVLNSQGYTQAAWWNRIPISAWTLLIVLSIFCNLLIGYRAHRKSTSLFLILPIALSLSLFLIADIDSPRRGVIQVDPQNLQSLADSLHAQ